MSKHYHLIIIIGLAVTVAGCSKPADKQTQTPPKGAGPAARVSGEILVFVPCGVAGPYGEIKKLFEAKYPGVKVTQELANIDVQTKLILDGKAAPDMWIALGDREMNRVKEAGKVAGEPVTFAYNSIAFTVHKNNPCGIASLQDLTKPSVKTIALATPENSSGYYAEQAFRQAGVWEQVEKKIWLTPEPAQVKVALSSGKAEVGVVYYPCARETRIMGGEPEEMKGKLQLLNKFPEDVAKPFPAQAAVIQGCANPEGGKVFLDFMLSDEVQDVWEKWAFDRAKQPASGKRVVLYMYCGAGIRPMMDAAIEAFKQVRPNVRIDVGYAGSGCLLGQLTFGKRGDLYMPGEDFYLNQAMDRGYIASSKPIGYFEPVLLVAKGNPKNIKTLQDLTRPGLKVALGDAKACAVGLTADRLLGKAGLAEKVEKNVAVRHGNVPELGNAVKFRTIDVSIVWNVTATQQLEDCDSIPIDRKYYEPSLAPIGLLKFSKHSEEAQAFIDFLAGPEGQKIVADSGMTPAAGSKAAGSGS
ncbi:MAG: molybdate ABC transporter substrate-binding protein [Armatimonadetes bacterium]|nr:molybdate ABC transporter substrate-binding protein [Armatimonadota bacterium]